MNILDLNEDVFLAILSRLSFNDIAICSLVTKHLHNKLIFIFMNSFYNIGLLQIQWNIETGKKLLNQGISLLRCK